MDYSPRLSLDFGNVKGHEPGDIPILQDKTLVKVDIDEADKWKIADEDDDLYTDSDDLSDD